MVATIIKIAGLSGYPTIGSRAYLGRAPKTVKRRAQLAGLRIINVREFRRLERDLTTIGRILKLGTWYDTVRY